MERKQNAIITELPLLLKVEAAAKMLSLGRSKMYELIASGEVPSVRVGRSVRVPVASLKQWVDDLVKQNVSA